MTLDPQAKALLDSFAALAPADYDRIDAAQMRARSDTAGARAAGDAVEREDNLAMPGPGGPLRLRLYRGAPGEHLPLLVYFHGGGFVVGTLDRSDNICRCLARRAGALVVSVDYRLAPEAPFPAAVNDACAALAWVHRNAGDLGGDAARIAVAGDSAGGNLAAVAAQQARDHGPALCHQLLIYPVTDCHTDTESYRLLGADYGLTSEEMRWYYRQYLPEAWMADDARASPLRSGDLSGLPPATVITAEYDPLRAEGEAYAEAMRGAGVTVQLRRWPGQIHGFFGMLGTFDAADAALNLAAQALRQAFTAEAPAV